ncbi:MAG TPA: hypothetical protein V6C81_03790 [Planktothrix sp.]|jgi:hypothetical protein
MTLEKTLDLGAAPASANDSLWQEAYEHPVTTAGAVAATAGALYLGGTALGRLALKSKPCEVLLFERTKFMGKALEDVLKENGHNVTWLSGMKNLDQFVGQDLAGSEVALDPKKFDFAVVAGGLDGKFSGMDIVGNLTTRRIPSLGLGTSSDMTDALKVNGAIASNKAVGFQSLLDKSFNLRGAMRTPQTYQAHLDDLATKINVDPSLRSEAEARLMKAMQETND